LFLSSNAFLSALGAFLASSESTTSFPGTHLGGFPAFF
jgi:hypothetical protein